MATREEVRNAILTFLDGEGAPYDWDDFTSIPIKDPFLDAVRILCSCTHEAYPEPGTWCSIEGMNLMRAIAEAL